MEINSISRRNALRAMASSSTFASTVNVVSGDSGTVEIVTIRGEGGRIRQTKDVDDKWWNLEKQADDVRDRLEKSYSNIDQFRGVSTVATDNEVNNRKVPGVVIYFDPIPAGLDAPTVSESIPIEVKEFTEPEENACKEEVDFLYGGDAVDEPDDTGPGSATGIVTQDGERRLMTADHVVATDPCYTPDNEIYNYNSNGSYIGDVLDKDYSQDWATVGLQNHDLSGYDGTIRGEYGRVVAGYQTNQGLKDLRSSDETVYHRGWATCKTFGQVTETDYTWDRCTGAHAEDHFVKTSCDTDGGDSGGPHYTRFSYSGETYLSIISVHRGGESLGCAAYRITEDHDIRFDQTQYS